MVVLKRWLLAQVDRPLMEVAFREEDFSSFSSASQVREAKLQYCCHLCEAFEAQHADHKHPVERRHLKVRYRHIPQPQVPSEAARQTFLNQDAQKCGVWHVDKELQCVMRCLPSQFIHPSTAACFVWECRMSIVAVQCPTISQQFCVVLVM